MVSLYFSEVWELPAYRDEPLTCAECTVTASPQGAAQNCLALHARKGGHEARLVSRLPKCPLLF